MKKLEEMVWPQVKAKIIEILDEINKVCENSLSSSSSTRSPVAIIEAAVLLDAGWGDLLDAVWVVKLPREKALHRMVRSFATAYKYWLQTKISIHVFRSSFLN